MTGNHLVKLGLAGLLLAGLATTSNASDACGNVVRRTREDVKYVAQAEHQLRQGNNQTSVNLLARAGYDLRRLSYLAGGALQKRALRVTAKAIVRTGGTVTLPHAAAATDAKKRAKLVEWAVGVLAAHHKQSSSPTATTDYAEALSRDPKTAKQARQLLEQLDKKNLVTSAFGYAALARLRHAAGDSAGTRAAMDSCRKMAAQKRICQLPGGGAGGGSV